MIGITAIISVAQEAGKSPIRIVDGRVYAPIDGKVSAVGRLARYEDMDWGFDYTFAHSADGNALVFLGEERGEFGAYLYELGDAKSILLPVFGRLSWRSGPVWSPDGMYAALSAGGRIYVIERETSDAWQATEPPEEWMEDIDPEFERDGYLLFFYRGATIDETFEGRRFLVEIYGGEAELIPEFEPKYPSEGDSFAFAPDFGEYEFWMEMLYHKVERFARQLAEHDIWGLLLEFDPSYLTEQLDVMEAYPLPMNPERFDQFFFNGAIMYDDYRNQIPDLESIAEVVEFGVDEDAEVARFVVRLRDGRTVGFIVMYDTSSMIFRGALG